mmetsp:Transcript_17234/g.32622  ORF Transcript_17234/g.32622 Transcript_17234/m.32622 type:complete len:801 (+) Transcript_17234:171-2573(+)
MGINGLLKALSPLLIPINNKENDNAPHHHHHQKKTTSSFCSKRNGTNPKPKHNIRQFHNKTLAIDASSWLYKASYSISSRLVEAVEENRIDAVCERVLCQYMVKRCEELLTHAGIKRIYLVFDGERCPLKAVTNEDREAKRRVNLVEARRLLKLGLRDQAMEKYKLCIKVVPWMAQSVAKAVSQRWKDNGHFANKSRVQCVLSPYEADAQLVKLVVDGVADAVVTEDSDVLVYSAACNRSFPIVYKLDRDGGDCDVISMDWLLCPSSLPTACKGNEGAIDHNMMYYPSLHRLLSCQLENDAETPLSKQNTKKSSGGALQSHLLALVSRESRKKGSGARMFVQACMLSGCDYAPSQLSGVGIVTAFKVIKENAHRDPETRFLHVLKSFPKEKMISVNPRCVSETIIENENIDALMKEYEELLAKSECIFYFHKVLDKHGAIVPLVNLHNEEQSDQVGKTTVESIQDHIPKTDRFQDETFLGALTLNVDTGALTYPLGQKVKQPTSRPVLTNKTNCMNPYKKNNLKPASLQANTENPLSKYAHDKSSSSFFCSKSRQPTKSLPKEKYIEQNKWILDDDSSNDELDDVVIHTSMASFQHSNKPKQNPSIISKTSSLVTPSDRNNNDDKNVNSFVKSRYFFSQNSILSKSSCSTPSLSQTTSTNISSSSGPKLIRTVTPSMAELEARDSGAKEHSTKQSLEEQLSSDDDDDCIIIEEDSFIGNMTKSTTMKKNFTSTFSQAQSQGTRAKFSSWSSSSSSSQKKQEPGNVKNKRRHSSKGLEACTKKAKSNLITGFFSPLTNSPP